MRIRLTNMPKFNRHNTCCLCGYRCCGVADLENTWIVRDLTMVEYLVDTALVLISGLEFIIVAGENMALQ